MKVDLTLFEQTKLLILLSDTSNLVLDFTQTAVLKDYYKLRDSTQSDFYKFDAYLNFLDSIVSKISSFHTQYGCKPKCLVLDFVFLKELTKYKQGLSLLDDYKLLIKTNLAHREVYIQNKELIDYVLDSQPIN